MEGRYTITQLAEDDSIIWVKQAISDWTAHHDSMDEVFAIVTQSDKRFDLILDVPPKPPPGLPLTHFRKTSVLWSKHLNLKSFTIVGLNTVSSTFMGRVAQIALNIFLPPIMRKVYYMDTFEAAMDNIATLRANDTVSSVAS